MSNLKVIEVKASKKYPRELRIDLDLRSGLTWLSVLLTIRRTPCSFAIAQLCDCHLDRTVPASEADLYGRSDTLWIGNASYKLQPKELDKVKAEIPEIPLITRDGDGKEIKS